MPTDARLGVVLCTYNGARFVDEQLASIAAQTRLPDVLVAFDDGSSDDTAARLARFADGAPFAVEVTVNAERLGAAANFERGIAACDASVIALADQDDVWLPRKLERLATALDAGAPGAALSFCDADLVDESGRDVGGTSFATVGLDRDDARRRFAADAFGSLLRRRVVPGGMMAFDARVRALALPFPDFVRDVARPWVIHDGWISLLAAGAFDVEPVAERLAKYRVHASQVVGLDVDGTRRSRRARTARRRGYETNRSSLERMTEHLGALRSRLASAPSSAKRDASLSLLDDRIAHFGARAAMPRAVHARLPAILRELRAGRYARHSAGLAGAMGDVRWW